MSTTRQRHVIPDVVDFVKTRSKQNDTELVALLQNLVDTSYSVQLISGDGAITNKEGVVVFTKGSAGAITIAAPTATTDDNKRILCLAGSAQAHVITDATAGFNGKGSSGTCTFGGAIGDSCILVAYQGVWHVTSIVNVTVA